ncbi:hypothetical protein AAFC00_002880 [Neodothiora populina]|uniref:Transcriptional regulatory protein DEP1 n=1 Tax=Neodothiora populina TaxID=2781224 RepID=A0ABR3P8J1_9PEZI
MIALPATAEPTEPGNTTDMSLQHPSRQRSHTPRSLHTRNSTPSISPLSTTSRSNVNYFDHTADDPPKSPLSQRPTLTIDTPLPLPESAAQPDVVMRDQHDSDNQDDDDNNNNNNNDKTARNGRDRDDGSSSLSDFDGNLDEQEATQTNTLAIQDADSEAETERLEPSPQKSWRLPDTTRTPSKLNQETSAPDHWTEPASSPATPRPDPQSPSPAHRTVASPSALAGQKRKRSPPLSEPDSPLSEAASDSDDILLPRPTDHVDSTTANEPEESIEETNIEETTEHPTVQTPSDRETPEPDDVDQNPYISPMKAARLKGKKQRAKRLKEASAAPNKAEGDEDIGTPLGPQEDEDGAPKSDDDAESKRQAQAAYAELADKFHMFRTKLHGEKLAAAEAELDLLNRPEPAHPEFIAQLQCITSRRDTKIQQEYARLRYKSQSIINQTLGEHAQLHTQFFQEARKIREERLDELGRTWYDIQKERRQFQADQADKYTYKFPTKYSDQIRNQANYNREVSIISGMQRYVGFPAAPEIHGARSTELDDDLKAMKLPRHQLPVAPAHPNTHDPHGLAARAAREKWVEQNPWANAQHPFHQQSRSPFSLQNQQHANLSVNLFRQGSAQPHRTQSPFTTPMASQKRADFHPNGLNSGDTIAAPSDPPSSAVTAAPNTDKTSLSVARDDGSPISSLKVRSALANPLANHEDRRNFSNISSTSTIDAPNDGVTAADHERHHYAGPMHGPAMQSSLLAEASAAQHGHMTNPMHMQHGKADDRAPEQLYDSVNFRRQMGGGGPFGTPVPLFAGRSPVRKEGQRAL